MIFVIIIVIIIAITIDTLITIISLFIIVSILVINMLSGKFCWSWDLDKGIFFKAQTNNHTSIALQLPKCSLVQTSAHTSKPSMSEEAFHS